MWLLNWYFCAWFVQCLSRFSLNFSVVSAVTTSSGSEFHTGTILWLNAIFDLILASKNGPRDCFLRIFDQHLPFLALDLTPLFENFFQSGENFFQTRENFYLDWREFFHTFKNFCSNARIFQTCRKFFQTVENFFQTRENFYLDWREFFHTLKNFCSHARIFVHPLNK